MSALLVHNVFVYGSLLSNLGNHHILSELKSHARLISSECLTVNKFYLTGLKSNEHPYLSEVPLHNDQLSYRIKGELYQVSDDALSKLDWFEEHPVEYFRSVIEVNDLTGGAPSGSAPESFPVLLANIYLLKNEERIAAARADFDLKFVIVNSGDWKSHLKVRLSQ